MIGSKVNRPAGYLVGAMLVFFLVAGCSSAGRQFDPARFSSSIEKGKSTKKDVIEICGQPLSTRFDSTSGVETWHYAAVNKHVTGTGVVTNLIGIGTEWQSDTMLLDVQFKGDTVEEYQMETSSRTQMHQSLAR